MGDQKIPFKGPSNQGFQQLVSQEHGFLIPMIITALSVSPYAFSMNCSICHAENFFFSTRHLIIAPVRLLIED